MLCLIIDHNWGSINLILVYVLTRRVPWQNRTNWSLGTIPVWTIHIRSVGDFDRSVNPISTRGPYYAHHITTGPLHF